MNGIRVRELAKRFPGIPTYEAAIKIIEETPRGEAVTVTISNGMPSNFSTWGATTSVASQQPGVAPSPSVQPSPGQEQAGSLERTMAALDKALAI